jgi:vancomycin resistance protein YoaR
METAPGFARARVRSLCVTLVMASAAIVAPAGITNAALPPNMSLLARWTTRFVPGPSNGGGVNIRIPAQRIDGTVIQPGGRFSFNRAVSPVTNPPYKLGGFLRGGRIAERGILGGGMCSASTTIFNAAARAGLTIVERHNHALYISRYPVGLDATVFSSKDMVFVNDTAHPVLIKGISGRRTVTFEVYGVDDGRTVQLSEPRIVSRREAKAYIEYTDELAPGVRRRVTSPYDGFESWVTRTVRDRDGNVIHRNTFRSRYRALDGLVKVGRYPGDPASGTRILASQYRRP